MEPEDPPVTLIALRYDRRSELFGARLATAESAVLRLAPSLAPPRGDVVSPLTEDQLLSLLGAATVDAVDRARRHPDLWYDPGRDRFLTDDETPPPDPLPSPREVRP